MKSDVYLLSLLFHKAACFNYTGRRLDQDLADSFSSGHAHWTQFTLAPMLVNRDGNDPDLESFILKTKVNHVNLGYISGDATGYPYWNGKDSIFSTNHSDLLKTVRTYGGDAVVSFGRGNDLASSATSYIEVYDKYRLVVDLLGLKFINIEFAKDQVQNETSFQFHLESLAELQSNHPELKIAISVSLDILNNGTDVDVLESISDRGDINIDTVIVNAFNYKDSETSKSAMGTFTIGSIEAIATLIRSIGVVDFNLGICFVAGLNAASQELFSPSDATQVFEYVKTNPNVTYVSFYSTSAADRDAYSTVFTAWSGAESFLEKEKQKLTEDAQPVPAVEDLGTVQKRAPLVVSTDGTCGPKSGRCSNPACCSNYGFCGISVAFCGSGCQAQYGRCKTEKAAEGFTKRGTPSSSGNGPQSFKNWFAPYLIVSQYPLMDMTRVLRATGTKYFILAFILADYRGNPAWDGTMPMSQRFFTPQINAIRAAGGDISISFGGAAGTYLATVTTNVQSLTAKYQSVIDTYKVKRLDFDVEGVSLYNKAANDRRSQALVSLRNINPGLIISFTLPVSRSGLTTAAYSVLTSARRFGLQVDFINIMAMDYGGPWKDMGEWAIAATRATWSQVQQSGLKGCGIGITPMIGQNDVWSEVFTLDDAQSVLSFARQNSYVKLVSFWSVNRDRNCGNCPLHSTSKISQSLYQFSSIFAAYDN